MNMENLKMNAKVEQYLNSELKKELKFMYSYNIDDNAFGVETDYYGVLTRVLERSVPMEDAIKYLKRHYGDDYSYLEEKVKELQS